MSAYTDDIRQHYEQVWQTRAEVKRWILGPTHELPEDFRILELYLEAQKMWAYATSGMSQPEDDPGVEVHLFSPWQDDGHVELLTTVAHYHRTCSRLYMFHSVNFGRPWLPDSTCSFGMISLPYLDGPTLEIHRSSISGKEVRFLWLLPITEQEREFKRMHGTDALEELFEKDILNYLDPRRDSVV